MLAHILVAICCDNPKSAYAISSFPPTGYQPAVMITGSHVFLKGESLSCPARNVDHLMTSDVNKWRDVTPNLRHSCVLLTSFMSNASN